MTADKGSVGQIISLTDRIAARELQRAQAEREHADLERRRAEFAHDRAAFFFALDCPVSYLVAERVERDLGEIAWTPMLSPGGAQPWAHERLRRAREEALYSRLPLIEPDNYPSDVRPATRAAAYAALNGAGSRFALAALRLAFAGGFDLSEPDVIAEAAAAAELSPDAVLAASQQQSHDHGLAVTARGLRTFGILQGPALRICGGWFTGFDALTQSSEFTAARASYQRLAHDLA